jgi:hypothetical protein
MTLNLRDSGFCQKAGEGCTLRDSFTGIEGIFKKNDSDGWVFLKNRGLLKLMVAHFRRDTPTENKRMYMSSIEIDMEGIYNNNDGIERKPNLIIFKKKDGDFADLLKGLELKNSFTSDEAIEYNQVV